MPQNYTPEFKKKIVAFMKKMDAPTKALLLNIAYPKPVSPNGASYSVKNAS